MKNASSLRDFVIPSPLVPRRQNNATDSSNLPRDGERMSTDQGGSEPALGAAHRAAVKAWLWAMPEKTSKVIPR
jgi:hypothetical protein